jgi:hypothetical protein
MYRTVYEQVYTGIRHIYIYASVTIHRRIKPPTPRAKGLGHVHMSRTHNRNIPRNNHTIFSVFTIFGPRFVSTSTCVASRARTCFSIEKDQFDFVVCFSGVDVRSRLPLVAGEVVRVGGVFVRVVDGRIAPTAVHDQGFEVGEGDDDYAGAHFGGAPCVW